MMRVENLLATHAKMPPSNAARSSLNLPKEELPSLSWRMSSEGRRRREAGTVNSR